jgi:hypothetical protein
MTKEQLLQLVSEAYDEGARFDISVHHIREEKEAGEIADQFAEFFGSPCETDGSGDTGWHKLRSGKVDFTAYFNREVPVCVNCQK